VALLFLAHLLWIVLGRGSMGRLERLLNILALPSRVVSGRMEDWKGARRDRITNLRQAQADNQRLRAQVAQLQTTQEAQAPRVAEAEEAIRLLGLKKLMPLEFRAARVISNVRNAPFGGMILDEGEEAGLQPDQGVLCPDGVVGRIWEVSPNQSSLLPLDAYNASTGVMLARSRATGVLQGLGPGKAAIRYIASQEVVQVGEPVYTSGLDRIFPRGLLVGYVSAVKSREVELHVEVVLAAPLDRVGLVLILPPHPHLELQPPAPPVANPAVAPAGRTGAK
jgi:rod shape-determining protein MreC